MYSTAYICGILIFFPLWILCYLKRKDLRISMLIMGIAVGILAVLTNTVWFLKDYWHPVVYISTLNIIWQDFLLGFFLGGIFSNPYNFLLGKKLNSGPLSIKRAISILVIILLPFPLFTNLFGLNSIYSSILGLLGAAAILLIHEPNLLISSIISGLMALVICLLGYIIYLNIYPNIFKDWWDISNISGILIGKIPLEEIVWFASFGFINGSLYKYLYNNKKV